MLSIYSFFLYAESYLIEYLIGSGIHSAKCLRERCLLRDTTVSTLLAMVFLLSIVILQIYFSAFVLGLYTWPEVLTQCTRGQCGVNARKPWLVL